MPCVFVFTSGGGSCQAMLYNIDLLVDTEQNLLHLVYVVAHE